MLCFSDLPTFRIVGDNCDLRQHPRHQTVYRRDQDHHWFHMYAIKDRVHGLHLPDDKPIAMVSSLPLATFLPNVEDCNALHQEFAILVARVLIKHLPCFHGLRQVTPEHIPHEYSQVMADKSETVSRLILHRFPRYIIIVFFPGSPWYTDEE